MRRALSTAVLLGLFVAIAAGVAAADHAHPPRTTEDDDDGGDTIVNIDLGPVISAIQDLADDVTDLPGAAVNAFADFVLGILQAFVTALLDALTALIRWFPQVYPNDDMATVHRIALHAAFAMSAVTMVVTGLLLVVDWLHGISSDALYRSLVLQILALVFGAIAPPLLQYPVRLAELMTELFLPATPDGLAVLRFAGELLLAAVTQASVILPVVLVIAAAKAYLVWAVAMSPLLALGLAFPYARKLASHLIYLWYMALLLSPLEASLLRLNLALLSTPEGGVPSWILSIGTFTLMVAVPTSLYGVTILMGAGSSFARGARSLNPGRWRKKYRRMRRRQERKERRDHRIAERSGSSRRTSRDDRYSDIVSRDDRTGEPRGGDD